MGGHFLGGEHSCEGGGTFPKIFINLPRTYEKLHCKREQYRLSGYRDTSLQYKKKLKILTSDVEYNLLFPVHVL